MSKMQYDGTKDHHVRTVSILLAPIRTIRYRHEGFQVHKPIAKLRLVDFRRQYCVKPKMI